MASGLNIYGSSPITVTISRGPIFHLIPYPTFIIYDTDVQISGLGIHITTAHRFTDIHDVIVGSGVIKDSLGIGVVDGTNSPFPVFKECLLGGIIGL